MTVKSIVMMNLVLVFLFLPFCLPAAAAAEEELSAFYEKGATFAETLLASRAAFQNWEGGVEVSLGPWYATAPQQAEGFAQAHFPEQEVDLTATDPEGNPRWTERPDYQDGKVHNLPLLDYAATYLFRTLSVTPPMTLTAGLGSDDGFEIWLNGEKVFSKDLPRGAAPNQDRVPLPLKAGENRLLLKVYNIAGGHGFFFSLSNDPLLQVWQRVREDFPRQAAAMQRDLAKGRHLEWFREQGPASLSRELLEPLLTSVCNGAGSLGQAFSRLCQEPAPADDPRWLGLYCRLVSTREHLGALEQSNFPALFRAIEDLHPEALEPARALAARAEALQENLIRGAEGALERATAVQQEITAFRRKVLLQNPLLDFEQILTVKRKAGSPALGLPQNWQGNCSLPGSGYDDELVMLSPKTGRLSPFFKPEKPGFLGDVDLHFNADRMLFSAKGSHDRWQIFELGVDGQNLRQVTPGDHPDVDNYDACYLPDGRIIFDSSRCFQGIPCVGGADAVANLYIMDPDGSEIRRLCFDQDHDWCPTVLNSGRVLYTRWEYSDTPHYFTRLLFQMNPDGTGQAEYYGSNSYWPNSIFYARPIPGHPTQVVGIVSGHHGVPRMGELVIFDPAKGRFEADGVVQRIPGFGRKVEPIIKDQLVNDSWPRFLHPYPLSEHYFLVSCQPEPGALWGIYLVDVYDNLLCLAEEPGYALLEPVPFKKQPTPPVIPDKVRLDQDEAVIYLADVYGGPGLAGVPKDTVKELRVYAFHYAYNKMGGHIHVGIEGPWDVHRILGTVPVYEDGSTSFMAPANTPIAVQPLDSQGRAIQVMRSWFTAMPGEVLSCAGCHESQNSAPPVQATLASRRAPVAITPWRGPARGFSFSNEVQPVLDQYCAGCHDGKEACPDLTRQEERGWNNFTPAYIALHPFVRRPGPESDYHLLNPYEYHAGTSELIQMLEKGHHNVRLDEEAWDRLVTWIDLNVPDHGTWNEHQCIPEDFQERRNTMDSAYAGLAQDPEESTIHATCPTFQPPAPREEEAVRAPDTSAGFPFTQEAAERYQSGIRLEKTHCLSLGPDTSMEFALVPSVMGFGMGDDLGYADEQPETWVIISDDPFYLGRTEVTLAQYRAFDPTHDNGYIDQRHKDHTTPGYPVSEADHPVIRVSWEEAMAFCAWLSRQTGRTCTLPTEAQWEWACRAGSGELFHFGGLESDFSAYANLADQSIRLLAVTGVNPQPIPNPTPYQDYLPKDERFNDGHKIMAHVGQYQPSIWGLYDLHGNVWEWTRSLYQPYPYDEQDGRNRLDGEGRRVARGGSWRDRPKRSTAASRMAYQPFQKVFNVGFRVAMAVEKGNTE